MLIFTYQRLFPISRYQKMALREKKIGSKDEVIPETIAYFDVFAQSYFL